MVFSKSLAGLVGSTGFVGGQLQRQRSFSHLYYSRNIAALCGETLDLLVCAGAPATMWLANKLPEADRANLLTIVEAVQQARIDTLVLISTIAVLDDMSAGYTESTARFETKTLYGANRRELETALRDVCERVVVIRLPGLFAAGLKKNFLFDLANPAPSFLTPDRFEDVLDRADPDGAAAIRRLYSWDDGKGMHGLDRAASAGTPDLRAAERAFVALDMQSTSFTHSDSTYQFYNVARLWRDIERTLEAGLDTVHLGAPPLRVGDLHETLTGRPFRNIGPARITQDVRTDHAGVFGGESPYSVAEDQILKDLKVFYAESTRRTAD